MCEVSWPAGNDWISLFLIPFQGLRESNLAFDMLELLQGALVAAMRGESKELAISARFPGPGVVPFLDISSPRFFFKTLPTQIVPLPPTCFFP